MDQAVDRAAVTDAFRQLGIDITDLDDLNDLRDDFRFIRRQRRDVEVRRVEATKSLVAALVGGAIGMAISITTWLSSLARHPQ